MATEIFISGCTTCGMNAALVAKVKRSSDDVVVYNTKYDGAFQLDRHIAYLVKAGMKVDSYHSIVVENNGERISLLKEWKPLY